MRNERTRERRNIGEERGQMLAMLAVSTVALIACGAFVMDVGAWIQGHRATQTVADASALAGAQALPYDVGTANALALDYSTKNGGGVAGGDIQFLSNTFPNDTIRVRARRTGAGFLSRVLGITTVNLTADAEARAYNMGEATYAAPFGIAKSEPFLSGGGCPCYNQQTSFDLDKVGPGGFEIINIDGSRGGTSPGTLADWIINGLDQSMPLGWYYSDPGAKFNSSQVKNAMNSRVGSVLLFPVYDATQGNGANLQYRIVGWAGFYMTGWNAQGNNATISGYLKHVAWEGRISTSAANYFGAVVVKLTA
jgi:hypothetical protein